MAVFIEVIREGKPIDRREIPAGRHVVIGRTDDADWRIVKEPFLSRKHVEVQLESGHLKVRRIPEASNPIFYGGEEKDEFTLKPGDYFIIGKTRFQFLSEESTPPVSQPPTPDVQHAIKASELYSMGGDSDRMRLHDLLELPNILRTQNRHDFFIHIASMLRMATDASWACVMTEEGKILGKDSADDRNIDLRISRTLTKKALDDSPAPTFYCWSQSAEGLKATFQEGIDWAICAAARIPGEPAVFFYAAGRGVNSDPSSQVHRDNTRFIGLVADMVGRSMSVSHLQTWQDQLKRFFSGAIASKILQSPNLKDLEPRVAHSTVMFFDIRGFSKRTEDNNEKLLSYIGELRRVMTAMTDIILEEKGVVLQYTGDGILACWNVPFDDPGHVNCACRAALRMTSEISKVSDGWQCGIGLHTGEVVAGTIGSDQVFSYGLMGSVVNQASRVEGITKVVEIPVLVTREVAERVSNDVAVPMCIGRFQPAGMTTPLDLFDLVRPPGDPKRADIFSRGLKAFEKGEWDTAYEILDDLPAKDRPARFIKLLTEEYRRSKKPTQGWNGVIQLTEK